MFTVEYRSAFKRKEFHTCATTWVEVMLSEISPSQKDKRCMIPLTGENSDSCRHKIEWRLPGPEEGFGELVVNGYRVSVLQDRVLPELDGGDGGQTM